jgi:TRAP-type mannitol/chloroaromatic compound transport system substrate-binding protein
MKRRRFLEQGALGAAAALAACSPGKHRRGGSTGPLKRVSWRLVSSFPRGLDTIYGAVEVLAKLVEEMSGGSFQIRCYPAGEIVPGLQVLDAVQQGTVQLGQTASYYYTGKHPALAFDTAIPFGLSSRQQIAWLEEAGGAELLAPLFAKLNVVRFLAGGTGAQMGGWFRREINTVEDLRGLKMRIPGLGGDVMNRMGTTVQVLAGSDIYPALERGAIDATEWIGPYDDEKLGFHKIVKNYYYPGFWEPGPTLSYLVNKGEWDRLPAPHKAIFQAAASVSALTMLTRYDARNPAALARLREAGVNVRPFPEAVLSACRTEADKLCKEHAQKDATYAEIYAHFSAFRQQSFDWFATAENAYAQFAYGR